MFVVFGIVVLLFVCKADSSSNNFSYFPNEIVDDEIVLSNEPNSYSQDPDIAEDARLNVVGFVLNFQSIR